MVYSSSLPRSMRADMTHSAGVRHCMERGLTIPPEMLEFQQYARILAVDVQV